MKPIIIPIEKYNGKVTETSRKLFQEATQPLPDGFHELHLFRSLHRQHKGRYKWYWAYLLPELIVRCNLVIMCHKTAEVRPVTTNELHEHFKQVFNGGTIVNPLSGVMMSVGLSTTKLDDNEFICEYEDKIMSDYMTRFPEDFEGFLDREAWTKKMSEKWDMKRLELETQNQE